MDSMNSQGERNVAVISGKIASALTFSHEVYGEGFYCFTVSIMRLSNTYDEIPVIVSERLADSGEFRPGRFVKIDGQFRSYNSLNGGPKLSLMVFARDIRFIDDPEEEENINQVVLNGFICKPPIYRTTPFNREITDILLAVNRSYNKSDYIPIIAWGRNARFAKNLHVGDNVKIWGRIQSRTYQKRISEEETITKTAYEVSINRMELVEKEEKEE